MAEGKGHTELPWRRSDSQTSMYGSEIVANTKVKSKRVVCRLGGPDREENTDLILAAVNTYPAVEGLVKALEDSRNAIEALIEAKGLDGAGLALGALNKADSALSRFRSLQNGGANG